MMKPAAQNAADAPLLWRAQHLSACVEEDRKFSEKAWSEVEHSFEGAVAESVERTRRRRLIYALLVTVILIVVSLPSLLSLDNLAHALLIGSLSVVFAAATIVLEIFRLYARSDRDDMTPSTRFGVHPWEREH